MVTRPPGDLSWTLDGVGPASEISEETKKKLKEAVQETIKKELEDDGITAAGHATGSISW